MTINVHLECEDFDSYRAARIKSLFNAERGNRFDFSVDTDIDTGFWTIGVVVGPSGSGKTSIGRKLSKSRLYNLSRGWPSDKPIIDAIAPSGDFNAVTAALSAVGLGSVPSWLRPYPVLSTGEQFRAGLARLLLSGSSYVVLDEFTSVLDRQIAKIGAAAFQKAWRRHGSRRAILLTPHYDILDYIEPDWIIDTRDGRYERSRLRRPSITVEIRQTTGHHWHYFKPHYYLDLPMPIAAHYFVATVQDDPVAHLAVSPMFQCGYYRATRLVVMPEWQGVGIGPRFLDAICQHHLDGHGRCGRRLPVLFHTSHPGLASTLRRNCKWVQKSANLYQKGGKKCHYGGHFRAVQGFAYMGASDAA